MPTVAAWHHTAPHMNAVTINRPVASAATAPGMHQTHFGAGTAQHPIHVEALLPQPGSPARLPIIMLHGGFHTGASYLTTPDGRPGWAGIFAQRGHPVYVPDWPGHGKSPGLANLASLSTQEVAVAIGTLIEAVGPAIVFAHSAAGPIAWWLAEQFSSGVAAIVGIAPGPPANIQKILPDDPKRIEAMRFDQEAGCPVYSSPVSPVSVDLEFIRKFWANSPKFPHEAIDAYARTVVPESARILNERFNIGGTGLRLTRPAIVGNRPILVATGEHDMRHPKSVDAALAAYLGADCLWLPDAGLRNNGHMLMIEENSHEIADLLSQWLLSKGF